MPTEARNEDDRLSLRSRTFSGDRRMLGFESAAKIERAMFPLRSALRYFAGAGAEHDAGRSWAEHEAKRTVLLTIVAADVAVLRLL
jgi:UDP-glucose 4-epimerase